MARRTQKQIELDCKRIQEAAKTATTMKEIEVVTGLTLSEIRTSLSKHPRISKKVQMQVEANKAVADAKKDEAIAATEKEKPNSRVEVPESSESVIPQANNESDFKMGFVIDTSMIEVSTIQELLSQICETDAKVILTSVVRKELNTMQFVKKDYKAKRARCIMRMAASRPEKFYDVIIDETLETHDDCIVKYCVDNRERVVLLTADKNMALDAREQLVKVDFKEVKKSNAIANKKVDSDVKTLNPARRIGKKLMIMQLRGEKRDIRVLDNGKVFVDGVAELRVGDDVLIAAKKRDCITFAHYQMINLDEYENCKLIYSSRIYNYDEIEALPQDSYKALARDFWNKHGLKK